MPSKTPKKLSKAKQKRKARNELKRKWAALSKELRGARGACEVCQSKEHLNTHHIIGRHTSPQYLLEKSNLIVLCPSCHMFNKNSAHSNGMWFSEWLRTHKAEQYAWIISHLSPLD